MRASSSPSQTVRLLVGAVVALAALCGGLVVALVVCASRCP